MDESKDERTTEGRHDGSKKTRRGHEVMKMG
jgi:hypothetical protein